MAALEKLVADVFDTPRVRALEDALAALAAQVAPLARVPVLETKVDALHAALETINANLHVLHQLLARLAGAPA